MNKVGPIALLALALALSACTDDPEAPSAAAGSSTETVQTTEPSLSVESDEPEETDSEETETPSAPASYSLPIDAPQALEMQSREGYKANLVARWKEYKRVQQKDIDKVCLEHLNKKVEKKKFYPPLNDQDYAFAVATAEVTADFPTINGFDWPEGWRVVANISMGNPSVMAACDTVNPDEFATGKNLGDGQASLSPESNKALIHFVEFGRKIPAIPEGINEPNTTLSIFFELNSTASRCVEIQLLSDEVTKSEVDCRSSYGAYTIPLPEKMLETRSPWPTLD